MSPTVLDALHLLPQLMGPVDAPLAGGCLVSRAKGSGRCSGKLHKPYSGARRERNAVEYVVSMNSLCLNTSLFDTMLTSMVRAWLRAIRNWQLSASEQLYALRPSVSCPEKKYAARSRVSTRQESASCSEKSAVVVRASTQQESAPYSRGYLVLACAACGRQIWCEWKFSGSSDFPPLTAGRGLVV